MDRSAPLVPLRPPDDVAVRLEDREADFALKISVKLCAQHLAKEIDDDCVFCTMTFFLKTLRAFERAVALADADELRMAYRDACANTETYPREDFPFQAKVGAVKR